jgi:two-component system sensor histidine kinase BaeS
VRRRAPGVRTYLLIAMMALAVVSVGITGVLVHANVATEVAQNGSQLSAKLQACIVRAVVEGILVSGAVGVLLALPIALHMARPLRRLNDVAGRMARGEVSAPPTGVGGGREMAELGTTLERLAATLRRQDELRRATAADVTHELRDAIGRVTARIEAVRDGVLDARAGLPQIALDARHLNRIVDDVQRLVEAQRPGLLMDKQPLDLAAVVGDRVAVHAYRFRAASIALRLGVRPAVVTGDPERLAQVVDNLLSNALRYTDPGGLVTVTLTHNERDAVIQVADSGIGIAEAHRGHVFDRFWRAPDARARTPEGSGVGLALVRDLVLAHHGRVEVVSRPGNGSRFKVFLPLHVPRRAAAQAEPAVPAPSEMPAPVPAAAHTVFTRRARNLLPRRTAS